ncbi:MAG: ComF family protein [Rickettsiales bacterium]|jgi:ComF family protein|nr:ComF family protein [Rickettsiales bacterium]
MSFIIDFLFPPSCPICKTRVSEHGLLCPSCWSDFNWISDPKCCRCGYPFPADLDLGSSPLCPVCASGAGELDWMRAACVYDEFSKNIMLPFKHAGALRYQKIMSRAMIWSLRELADTKIDAVLPVPLAYRRLFKRGYNQATLLARPIAKAFDAELDLDSIRRKYRPDMGHKNSKERFENIRGVFNCVNPDKIRGKTILLVDDVMTTGATFSELYKVLKRAGAHAVYGVVFCRVVRAI